MLKELLGELWTEEIEAKLTGKVEVVGNEQRIPKDRFDQVNTEKNQYKSKVEELMTTIKELEKGSEVTETLRTQLAELRTTHDEYVQKVELDKVNGKKIAALTKMLKETHNAISPDLLIASYDLSKLSFGDNNELVGAKETTDKLKEKYPSQFGEVVVKTPDVTKGKYKGKAFAEMSLNERTEFKESDPEGYRTARAAHLNK